MQGLKLNHVSKRVHSSLIAYLSILKHEAMTRSDEVCSLQGKDLLDS